MTIVVRTGCFTLVITFGFLYWPLEWGSPRSLYHYGRNYTPLLTKLAPLTIKFNWLEVVNRKSSIWTDSSCALEKQMLTSNQWKCPYLIMMYTHSWLMLSIWTPQPQSYRNSTLKKSASIHQFSIYVYFSLRWANVQKYVIVKPFGAMVWFIA